MHLEKKLCIKKRSLVRGGGTLMLAGGSEDGFFRMLYFRGSVQLDNALSGSSGYSDASP